MRSTPSSAPAAANVMKVIGMSGATSRTVPTMARTSSTVAEPSAARSFAPPRLARPTDTSTRSTSGVMFRSVHGLAERGHDRRRRVRERTEDGDVDPVVLALEPADPGLHQLADDDDRLAQHPGPHGTLGEGQADSLDLDLRPSRARRRPRPALRTARGPSGPPGPARPASAGGCCRTPAAAARATWPRPWRRGWPTRAGTPGPSDRPRSSGRRRPPRAIPRPPGRGPSPPGPGWRR